MAYVITVAGAGGKTTWIRSHAEQKARDGARTAVTTTTHIWNPAVTDPDGCGLAAVTDPGGCGRTVPAVTDPGGCGLAAGSEPGGCGKTVPVSGAVPAGCPVCRRRGVDYFGTVLPDGKLGPLSETEYQTVCLRYDAVFVEGDGSRGMPVKIPAEYEPAIPENTDEIVVIMGRHAIGRRLDVVCQRFPEYLQRAAQERAAESPEEYDGPAWQEKGRFRSAGQDRFGRKNLRKELRGDETVTAELLQRIAEEFYLRPLRETYPDCLIRFELGGPGNADQGKAGTGPVRMTLVLMASGFGRRYGGNKLLHPAPGQERPMAETALDSLQKAADVLEDLGIETKTAVVTQYQEIADLADPCAGARQAEDPAGRMQEAKEDPVPLSRMKPHRRAAEVVWNDEAAEGIAASIRLGTKAALRSGSDAVAFFTADMPYLPAKESARFLLQYLSSGQTFGCMEYRRREDGRMQPTVPGAMRLTRRPDGGIRSEGAASALLNLHGDRGAMRIIRQYPWDTYRYQISEREAEDIDLANS